MYIIVFSCCTFFTFAIYFSCNIFFLLLWNSRTAIVQYLNCYCSVELNIRPFAVFLFLLFNSWTAVVQYLNGCCSVELNRHLLVCIFVVQFVDNCCSIFERLLFNWIQQLHFCILIFSCCSNFEWLMFNY